MSISTGDLDIASEVTQDWTLDRNGYEPNTGTSVEGQLAKFENLKTGDVLIKKVTITNKGTLKAVVNFNENENVTNKLPKGIEYTATFRDKEGNELKEGAVICRVHFNYKFYFKHFYESA